MPSCTVKSCAISAYQAKQVGISLHTCPKNPEVRKQWISFCRIKDEFQKFHVCSQHFKKEDFEHRFQENSRNTLSSEAVPSQYTLPPADPSPRTLRAEKKANSEIVAELIKQHDANTHPTDPTNEADRFGVDDHVLNNYGSLESHLSYSATFHRVSQFMQESIRDADVLKNTCENPTNMYDKSVTDLVPPVNSTIIDYMFSGENDEVMLCDEVSSIEVSDSPNKICLGDISATESKADRSIDPQLIHKGLKPDKFDREAETGRLKTIRDLRSTIDHQKQIICELKAELQEKQMTIDNMNRSMEAMCKSKDKQISDLSADLEAARTSNCDILKMAEEKGTRQARSTLMKVFTANQADMILGLKKKVIWTLQEIEMAFSLRYHSQPAYEIVRTEMKIPLPCLRTLREWASRIQLTRGVFTDVLSMLEVSGKQMSPLERVVGIAFDEMSVKYTVESDKRNDTIVGPHREMQVASVRGLFSKFKQPIYANFDQKMTKAILEDLARRLYAIGFTLVASVNDCGGGNMGLWAEVGIDYTEERTSMKHPEIEQEIYFFADPPHLLKLIRNHLLDDGFYYKGKLITKKFLVLLVEKASTLINPFSNEESDLSNVELNALYKLTSKHLTVTGPERQNVRMAAELLSHTTAVNLRRHFGQYEEAMLLAEVIDKFNAWFDVMNSHQLYENVPTKKCYGVDLQRQNKILDDMVELMTNMRTLTKHCLPYASHLQLFQTAVLTSIISFKNLFAMMHVQYDVEFIMGYKFNQDFQENMFAMIRLHGGSNDHPTPLQALDRLRLIILGKNLNKQLKRNQNTSDSPIEEHFIMGCLFDKQNRRSVKSKTQQDSLERFIASDEDEDDESWFNEPKERSLEEQDGMEYVMGYIARSVLKTNPEMGTHTYKLKDSSEDGLNKENYVEDLSYGGLIQPSEDWMKTANQMESVFNHIHNTGVDSSGIGFKQRKNVKQRTIKKLQAKFPHISENVIKSYATRRINIRVKRMKTQLEEQKLKKIKIIKNRKKKPNAYISDQVDKRSASVMRNQKKIKHFRN